MTWSPKAYWRVDHGIVWVDPDNASRRRANGSGKICCGARFWFSDGVVLPYDARFWFSDGVGTNGSGKICCGARFWFSDGVVLPYDASILGRSG